MWIKFTTNTKLGTNMSIKFAKNIYIYIYTNNLVEKLEGVAKHITTLPTQFKMGKDCIGKHMSAGENSGIQRSIILHNS